MRSRLRPRVAAKAAAGSGLETTPRLQTKTLPRHAVVQLPRPRMAIEPAFPELSSRESALVVLVPEAEAVVKTFRDKYDPSAAAGMPAHITLLYPFTSPDELRTEVLETLHTCFVHFVPFTYSLAAVRRFPSEVLYLAPEPDRPFRDLTSAICERFPDRPPYGGKFEDVIPHLTVAQVQNDNDLDRIAEDFALAARGRLPIRASATEVALMDNRSGDWQIRHLCALGRTRR